MAYFHLSFRECKLFMMKTLVRLRLKSPLTNMWAVIRSASLFQINAGKLRPSSGTQEWCGFVDIVEMFEGFPLNPRQMGEGLMNQMYLNRNMTIEVHATSTTYHPTAAGKSSNSWRPGMALFKLRHLWHQRCGGEWHHHGSFREICYQWMKGS